MASSSKLPEQLAQAVQDASAKHPRPDSTFAYQYGTAGFRLRADKLDSVLFRVGLLAALRSKKQAGKAIGVMVTASHNPEQDNGVKLVDPHGEMLEASWEAHATLLANAVTPDALTTSLNKIVSSCSIDLSQSSLVVYGHDTRPSCPSLVQALEEGLAVWQGKTVSAGLVTTPQLHYLVKAINTQETSAPYGEPTVQGYYDKLAKAFLTLRKGKGTQSPITVDCANGVGAPKLRELVERIGSENFAVKKVKDETSTAGALNSQCGADFVKTQQRAPPGISLVPGHRYCSLDGDADRIVFYYAPDDGSFRLLDGDKVAGLAAMFFIDLVKEAGLELDVGVVQTAYANGSSTAYLENTLKVPVACVPTGVKHLHHAAERYDIGVYFEANGHGTVLFSPEAFQQISSTEPSSPNQQSALSSLHALTELINQTVGDALSDLLLVETILMHKGWGPKDWDAAYTDLPNRLVKVLVQDRNAFTTTDAERTLVTPKGLQARIDSTVAKYTKGRSFVRPSGTEDCVRVYAEAATKAEADELAYKISGIVFDVAGLGSRPAEFA